MGRWLAGAALLLFVALATNASAETHIVKVRNFAFDPDTVTVQTGDVVRWEWESGDHTVTNGADFGDPALGDLFDEVIDSANPSFEYTFDTVGNYPYLCRPHFFAGMVGLVRVEDGTPVETDTWGKIKKIFERTKTTGP